MCGRFSLYISPKLLEEHYDAHFEDAPTWPEYNVPPTATMPIITNEDTHLFRWLNGASNQNGLRQSQD